MAQLAQNQEYFSLHGSQHSEIELDDHATTPTTVFEHPHDVNQISTAGTPQGQASAIHLVPTQGGHNTDDSTSWSPDEWKSRWLGTDILLLMSAVTLTLMASIITLAVISKRNHGIASANLSLEVLTSIIPDVDVGIGLLWTFLPVLIFEGYVLAIGAVVKAAADRQPYIELREPGENRDWGAAAEKSIMLDYQSYWAPVAPVKALKYNHYMLAFSFTIMLLLTLILTSLSAHIFFATSVPLPKEIEVRGASKFAGVFNDNAFGYEDSLTPTMEIVASTLIYGGKPIKWTTLNESILPFSLSQLKPSGVEPKNLTIPAQAYSAGLDCKILGPTEFELAMESDRNWYFSVSDRGCSEADQVFAYQLQSPFDRDFVETFSMAECSPAAHYSRILVIGARDANSSRTVLTNKTAVSCIPSYYNVSGSLSLTIDSSTPDYPTINQFLPERRIKMIPPPAFAASFERSIGLARYFDPDGALTASQYGSLIYTYAKRLHPKSYLTGEPLLEATASTFVSAFAVMANQFLVLPNTPESVQGTVYSYETRVIVVQSVAYTIVGILSTVLIMLGWIHFYTRSHHSILYEEPKALLGAASILRNSKLMERIEAIDANQWSGDVTKAFCRDERERYPAQGWLFDNWNDPKTAFLSSTPWARRFGYFHPYKMVP